MNSDAAQTSPDLPAASEPSSYSAVSPSSAVKGYLAAPKLYRVIRLIPRDDKTQQAVEAYYVASHIKTVIETLRLDLQDEATEIEEIKALVPIAAILPDNDGR
jgi:hypothetical protein